MRLLLGNIGSRSPLDYAEAAIVAADEISPRSHARFALTCGKDGRLWVRRFNQNNPVNSAEWLATFDRKSDPDWLADEIAAERGRL